MVAYVNQSNNKMKAKFNHMKRNVLLSFGKFSSFWRYLYGSPFTLVIDH
jgi:hypothetical protein